MLVAYYFPPLGGTGVLRNISYCKYLPQFDWQARVLTVKNVAYYSYDEAALAKLEGKAAILRAGSLDPLRLSYLLSRALGVFHRRARRGAATSISGAMPCQGIRESDRIVSVYRWLRNRVTFPDAQIGWLPFAVAKGVRAVGKDGIDVVLGSSPPYSAAVVAWLIAAITKRPLVLDFRDGWTGDPMLKAPTGFHEIAHRKLEAFLLSRADCILCYGESLADRWRNRYPELSDRIFVNPNGFDPEDFSLPVQRPEGLPEARRTIIWTGSLYEHLHRAALLTLMDACARLPAEVKTRLRFRFVGRAYAGVERDALRAGPDLVMQFVAEQPHSEAVRLLMHADAALMLLMPENRSIVSNKVFEYLGAGIPILSLVEHGGACAKVLRQAGRDGYIASPTDVEAVAAAISRLVADGFPRSPALSAEQFSRRYSARTLAQHLNAVTNVRPSLRKQSPGLQKR